MMDIEPLISTAQEAGKKILEVYHRDDFNERLKSDKSPITDADLSSNEVIRQRLKSDYPHIPIISEEDELPPFEEREKWKEFFLVDPLDGTKDFLKKNDQFTVNIAYFGQEGKSLGVIYVPVSNTLYYGDGKSSYRVLKGKKELLPLCSDLNEPLKILRSSSHLNEETIKVFEILKSDGFEFELTAVGSSLKFCMVAEGNYDLYLRVGSIMEWDTAAAQIILEGANCLILDKKSGDALNYNKKSMFQPSFMAFKKHKKLALLFSRFQVLML
jgi:3'(2'), 5'-bisphosphate nucleotidase